MQHCGPKKFHAISHVNNSPVPGYGMPTTLFCTSSVIVSYPWYTFNMFSEEYYHIPDHGVLWITCVYLTYTFTWKDSVPCQNGKPYIAHTCTCSWSSMDIDLFLKHAIVQVHHWWVQSLLELFHFVREITKICSFLLWIKCMIICIIHIEVNVYMGKYICSINTLEGHSTVATWYDLVHLHHT
jgi:hypothetical protein